MRAADSWVLWAMIVALTGASGFIGTATAEALASAGHEVTALIRGGSRRERLHSHVHRYVEGDQADPGIWRDLLAGAQAVVHNSVDWDALRSGDLTRHLRANVEGSVLLLEAAHRAGARRFVFVSSVAVHHEISPRWGGLVDEDHPLRPGTLYGASKAAVEPFLWMAHHQWDMHTAAVRPSGVYGVEPVNLARSHGYRTVKKLLEGGRVTPADCPGGGKFVHVDDVALAIVRAVERDAAAGRAFHLADCYAKFTRFGEHARDALGLPADRVEPDTGPPARNAFDKSASRDVLGVPLDRGDEGLRAYVRELIEAIRAREGVAPRA